MNKLKLMNSIFLAGVAIAVSPASQAGDAQDSKRCFVNETSADLPGPYHERREYLEFGAPDEFGGRHAAFEFASVSRRGLKGIVITYLEQTFIEVALKAAAADRGGFDTDDVLYYANGANSSALNLNVNMQPGTHADRDFFGVSCPATK